MRNIILPLVPSLLFIQFWTTTLAQSPSATMGESTPYQTGAFVNTPGCTIRSLFSRYGAAVGIAGDPHVWSLQTLITLAEPNSSGPMPEQNITDPFNSPAPTVTNYITSDQYEYGMELSFVPELSDNGAGTINFKYARWSGSASFSVQQTEGQPSTTYQTDTLTFPCWIHGP